ncbi:MAG: hypothetical protein KGI69_01675 [Patescibacteria group bacterium]|nr:hypothetical protein [Patescibacteria group bacterium]
MIDGRKRKMRLNKQDHAVKGWMQTDYAYGMMGTVGGFVFKAEFDFDGRDMKIEFIARPLKDLELLSTGKWIKEPLFPVTSDRSKN